MLILKGLIVNIILNGSSLYGVTFCGGEELWIGAQIRLPNSLEEPLVQDSEFRTRSFGIRALEAGFGSHFKGPNLGTRRGLPTLVGVRVLSAASVAR